MVGIRILQSWVNQANCFSRQIKCQSQSAIGNSNWYNKRSNQCWEFSNIGKRIPSGRENTQRIKSGNCQKNKSVISSYRQSLQKWEASIVVKEVNQFRNKLMKTYLFVKVWRGEIRQWEQKINLKKKLNLSSSKLIRSSVESFQH